MVQSATHRLLTELRAERDELNLVIRVLERRGGDTRTKVTRRNAAMALAQLHASSNGSPPPPDAPRPKRRGKYKPRQQSSTASVYRTGRPIATIPLPDGLTLAGLALADAITLTIGAIGHPIPTPELVSLLKRGGAKFKRTKHPIARQIGIEVSKLVEPGLVVKTADGWARGPNLPTP